MSMQQHANMYTSDSQRGAEQICSRDWLSEGHYVGSTWTDNSNAMNFQKHGLSIFFKMNSYPEKTIIQRDTNTPMFTVALFTTARTWKRALSIDRWMYRDDVVHVYNGILLSHKRNEIGSFVEMWMDAESVTWGELSWKGKNKYHLLMHAGGI